MSNKQLQKNIAYLKLLKKSTKPSERRFIIESADNTLIRCICECILNILNGNVKLNKTNLANLKQYAQLLCQLVDKKTTIKAKKNLLIQKGGFLPALLAPVIGVATSLIGDLVVDAIKKKNAARK